MRRLAAAAAFLGLTAAIFALLQRFVRGPGDRYDSVEGAISSDAPAADREEVDLTRVVHGLDEPEKLAGDGEVIIDLTDSAMAAARAEDKDPTARN